MDNRYFPVFVPTKDRKVLVVGGGKIATRRLKQLVDFSFEEIKVISQEICDEMKEFAKDYDNVVLEEEVFEVSDVTDDIFMVLACTNDSELNFQVGMCAKEKNIYASVASNKDEGNFYFPGIVTKDYLTMGIVGDGEHHTAVKDVVVQFRELVANKSFGENHESDEEEKSGDE